jgi:hypothetical protein
VSVPLPRAAAEAAQFQNCHITNRPIRSRSRANSLKRGKCGGRYTTRSLPGGVGDKQLQEPFEKLAGRRVVAQCRGEYKLGSRTAEKPVNFVRSAEEVPVLLLTLTAEKITAAK